MKKLFVLTLLVLINLNLCAIDRQIAVAEDVEPLTTKYTIACLGLSAEEKNIFYDNVITYKMKYFDTTEAGDYAAIDGATANVFNADPYLYSFNRLDTDSTYAVFEDPDQVPDNEKLFVRYHPIQYKETNPTDNLFNAYIAFNITPDCTGITSGKPPLLTMNVKFFCSEEEAKAEYDIIKDPFDTDNDPNLAWVNMSGVCDDEGVTSDFTAVLDTAVNVCKLLTGHATAICA